MIEILQFTLFGVFMLFAFWMGYKAGSHEEKIINTSYSNKEVKPSDEMDYLNPELKTDYQ